MRAEPAWTAMPAVTAAVKAGDIGTVLRVARTAAGLTLEQAGRLAGYSAATMSRWETRHRRAWTVSELRRLAEVYGIPPRMLGMPTSPEPSNPVRVTKEAQDWGEWMRRRDMIAGAVGAAAGAALPATTAATAATPTLEEVIFGRLAVAPISDRQLAAQLAAASADFRACRYTQLARRAPRLIAQATAARDQAPANQICRTNTRVAQAYSLTTRLLIKLHENSMATCTADRAMQAAHTSGDPLAVADATRLTATVLRRTHHRDSAQRLVLDAARQLDADTGLNDLPQAAMYGQLLATAAYTAAMRDDRDSAWTLLGEAEAAVYRSGAVHADRFGLLDLAVYRIGVARTLGDYGIAVDYARQVDLARIVVPERRARYWEDTALALHGRGRPAEAFRALLAAEHDAPQEVRYRPWAQHLTRRLMAGATRNSLPGIRGFAQRIGVG